MRAPFESVLVLSVAVVLSGCVDPMIRVEELAGPGATSCGFAPTFEARADASARPR